MLRTHQIPFRFAAGPALPGVAHDSWSTAARSAWGLPLLELPARFRLARGPRALIPQDENGSALIALDDDERPASGDATSLYFDATTRTWREARARVNGSVSVQVPPAEAVHAFRVPAGDQARPFALHELGSLPRESLGVDPETGLFWLIDGEGSTSGLARLRRKFGRSQGVLFEVLELVRDARGVLPSLLPGESVPARWTTVAAFDRDENWLFVEIRRPLVSFAMTG